MSSTRPRPLIPLAVAAALALTLAGCSLEPGQALDVLRGERATEPATPAPEDPDATPAPQREADREGTAVAPVNELIPQLVRDVEPSVVAVLTDFGEGSGVIYDADGLIVTNNHVVDQARQVRVQLADGERLDAEVIATDPLSDLAILRVQRGGLPAATFAEELPDIGEIAVAIGNPLGLENTVTAGIVSGLHRAVPAGPLTPLSLVDLLQTDAAISPGNSGGALINAEGQVIGINVAYLPPGESGAVSIGFAIPSPTVLDIVGQLLETGEVEYAFLGVQPTELTPQIAEQLDVGVDEGVLIQSIVPNSPAERAGLQPGDVIVDIGGRPTREVTDLFAALRQYGAGDEVDVRVVSGGREQTVRVRLSPRPAG
jgi:S1-C subfamily serine protease